MSTITKTRRPVSPPAGSPAPLPPLPNTAAGRQAAYADAVMAAVLTLQAQLRDPDATVSYGAAVAIIDLEKTRMRHDTPVAGTHAPSELLEPLPELAPLSPPRVFAATSGSGSPNPAPGGRGEEKHVNQADPWTRFVEEVRAELQKDADEEGQDEVISWAQAEACARKVHAKMREQQQVGQMVPAAPHHPRL